MSKNSQVLLVVIHFHLFEKIEL